MNTHDIQMGQAINSTNANTYCLDFDGSNDYLENIRTLNWNSLNTQGTIFAWIYIDSASDNTIFSSSGGNVIKNGDFENNVDHWDGAGYESYAVVGSGQSGNAVGAVSYTHLTLPTKA